MKKGVLGEFHRFEFARMGGTEMYAYDVNGDGLNDVITSLHAGAWGLSWFKQMRDPEGKITFKEHAILAKEEKGAGNRFGVQFSPRALSYQTHQRKARMSFDLEKTLESKRAVRRQLAARPVAEKLRLLDALRECALTLRAASAAHDKSSNSKGDRAR